MSKRVFILSCVAALALTGCHTITNLTPSRLPRNANNLYPVEVKWDHREQALRPESVKAFVMVGHDFYPMEKTLLLKNRWETLLPVPPEKDTVYYRFKFEYDINAIPQPKHDSLLSREYKLQIVNEKP